jgi:TRAP-type mannitol/chloroaromatic compound transport system substrate-binding protein
MKRRQFLKATSLSLLSTPFMSKNVLAASKKQRLRLALAVPKTFPIWGDGIQRFARNVETLTQGSVKIKVYGAGELMPAFETFDAVRSGDIDMHHSVSYYYQGKVPEAPYFSSIPFGLSPSAMNAWLEFEGQKLWDELLAPYGVQALPCGSPGIQSMGWFKKEISTPEDLKGLKIRIPGIASAVYAKLGAIPVLLPGGEVYTGLTTGMIDAVEWIGPYHDHSMGFHKVAPFLYLGCWHEPGSKFELLFNKEKWQRLSEEQKLAIKICAQETDRWMLSQFEFQNAITLEKIKDEGIVKIKHLSPELRSAFKSASEEILSNLKKASPIAARIHKSIVNFRGLYESYHNKSIV